MSYILAEQNGRVISKEDKIFGANARAKKLAGEIGADKVINGTLGSLLDDEGNLIVLSSVVQGLRELSPTDYADYAPIGGVPAFKEAVVKATLGSYKSKAFIEASATPGGTGAIRNTIANYSKPGDKVLTSDWFWAPYKTIAQENGRDIVTYKLFDENGCFNLASFEEKVKDLLEIQESLVILLNTPAHNPTGYSISDAEWDGIVNILNSATDIKGRIALFIDAAYIDFAGDCEKYRSFIPKLELFNEKVLPIIGYSLSKTFTLYGMRCGAMICFAKTKEIADEFALVAQFSSRGSWSNCVKSAQVLMGIIYADSDKLTAVDEERGKYREILIRRGSTFTEALRNEGVEPVPFDAGFFACVPCDKPDDVAARLEEKGVFVVALGKGLRICVAALSEEKLKKAAKAIAEVL
ncbi:MAG: pyridoxal phosphate-dependent aminotransferase [Anaerovoracaceae bacterium]